MKNAIQVRALFARTNFCMVREALLANPGTGMGKEHSRRILAVRCSPNVGQKPTGFKIENDTLWISLGSGGL